MELHMLRKVGSWDPIGGVNLTRTVEDIQREVGENLANKTMKIASRIVRKSIATLAIVF